ncbi:MAG: imidazoleglycerol-phosphate dehydratase HisB [Fodinibius sp.]|nr:imidazoleglycerol-phosphate dehydratase HisB [Fodinibius sp.]
MKIWIATKALRANRDELLWSGTLYGLKRLQQLEHKLAFDTSKLSDQQRALLNNEKITSENFSKSEADLAITAEDGQLACFHSEKLQHYSADWIELSTAICFPTRSASRQRTTAETDISIELNLDGTGQSSIDTGLGFFDHMLEQIAKHGLMDLELHCNGDLDVDEHHTIEDVAITLGETIDEALGNKIGIERYGFTLPMDETLAEVAIDLSGRPFLVFNGDFNRDKVGDFPTEMVKHFFYSLAINMEATMHISFTGENDHHKIEGCFKSFARCLRAAVSRSERNINVLPSTKDLL